MVEIVLRAAIAIVALAEAASLLVGAGLHLGVPIPAPFYEPGSLLSAMLEAVAGALLAHAAWGIAVRSRRAWQRALTAHVVGVGAVVFAIGARATGARLPNETSHHPATLLVLIVVLVILALPPSRKILGATRRRARHRRRGRRKSKSVPKL